MGFDEVYFKRYKNHQKIFNNNPCPNTGIIVVIPCYNDPFIFKTLESLENTSKIQQNIEVIIIVNSSENSPESIKKVNQDIFNELLIKSKNKFYKKIDILPHLSENIFFKTAGVGHARKTGMDEAVRRFSEINKPDGIIVTLDADSLVSIDYFTNIVNYFDKNQKSGACTIQFKHDFENKDCSYEEIEACKLYEIYLRYFRLSLKFTGFPYPIHTIGSCIAVKAELYTKAGGMSQRQAGEDFYFLHKLAPMTTVGTINCISVFPSPRISDRVPFGTGVAVQKIINQTNYLVYNFEAFKILRDLYCSFDMIFENKNFKPSLFPKELYNFISHQAVTTAVRECLTNTGNSESFRKRMFTKFDAFFTIRFLNSFDDMSSCPPIDILKAVEQYLSEINIAHNFANVNQALDFITQLDLDTN